MLVKTTLREALSDPRLLGRAIEGPSWHVWRTLLLAAMGEALTPAELETFRAVTGRETAPTERCEELIAIIGRRGGKSRAFSVLAVYLSTLCDFSDVLAPGEVGLLLLIAPDQRQAGVIHAYVSGALEQSELLRHLLVSRTSTALRLSNNVQIETRAASFRRLRGVTCIACIADESCFWQSESSANPDYEILNSVRPSLATTQGPLVICSTPYAKTGATWEAYSRDFGPQGDAAILVATGPSLTWNPSLDPRVVERAYARDPVAAAAEFGGEWRSDISAFIAREAVMQCVDTGVQERPFCQGVKYRAFVDPSGGSNDSMTLAISHVEGERILLDLVREVRPPFSPESVVAEFCETLAAYKIREVRGDRYCGLWPSEQFKKRAVTYVPSDKTASQIFAELLPLLNAGRVGLLDNKRLIDQLVALERRTSFGGKDSIGHADHRNAHDDVANAAAGSILLTTAKRGVAHVFDYSGRPLRCDREREPLRVRWTTISEKHAPAIRW